MTWHTGKDGVVKIGGNTVGELQGFGYEATNNVVQRGAAGKQWTESKGTQSSWTGEVTVLFDFADTGQLAFVPGATIAFEGYVIGEGSGGWKASGNATVGQMTHENPHDDAVERTFAITGDGALTEEAIA